MHQHLRKDFLDVYSDSIMQTVDLGKFQILDLKKDDGQAYTTVQVELGWKAKSQYETGDEIDVDSCALLLVADDKIENVNKDLVYPGAGGGIMEKHYSGAINHMGDNTAGGDGIGADESIEIHLDKLPAKYTKVMVLISIFEAEKSGQKIGMLEKAFARLIDPVENRPIVNIQLDSNSDLAGATALHFATIERKADNTWFIKNENRGFVNGLNDFFAKYGVKVENG